MKNFSVNFQVLLPEYLERDFRDMAKSYGVTPNEILRYFVWNARNYFEKGKCDAKKVQSLMKLSTAKMVVAQARDDSEAIGNNIKSIMKEMDL